MRKDRLVNRITRRKELDTGNAWVLNRPVEQMLSQRILDGLEPLPRNLWEYANHHLLPLRYEGNKRFIKKGRHTL